MNSKEKRLSFLNNYFIYKKVHSVNATQEELHYVGKQEEKIETEKKEEEDEEESPTPKQVRKIKKYKKKVKLPK